IKGGKIYRMFSDIITFIPPLLQGAWITIKLTFLSLIFALIIGVIAAIARISSNWILNKPVGIYISIIRGTPILVQLMFYYFVLPDLGLNFTPFISALIGLSLYEGAYLAEIIRAGIGSVGKGQIEAAYSIGMSYSTAM